MNLYFIIFDYYDSQTNCDEIVRSFVFAPSMPDVFSTITEDYCSLDSIYDISITCLHDSDCIGSSILYDEMVGYVKRAEHIIKSSHQVAPSNFEYDTDISPEACN